MPMLTEILLQAQLLYGMSHFLHCADCIWMLDSQRALLRLQHLHKQCPALHIASCWPHGARQDELGRRCTLTLRVKGDTSLKEVSSSCLADTVTGSACIQPDQ
jgi:hypothetical protein